MVWSPTATFPKLQMGTPQITQINGQPALQLEQHGAATNGVTFQPTVTGPTFDGVLHGGKYCINQLMVPTATGLDSNKAAVTDANTGLGQGLDNDPIYRKGRATAVIWDVNTKNPTATGDNPGTTLSDTTKLGTTLSQVTLDQSFVDTLMYRLDDNSNWVPLLVSTWSWKATATLANGSWKVTDPDPAVPPDTQTDGVSTTSFPSWKRVYGNKVPVWQANKK